MQELIGRGEKILECIVIELYKKHPYSLVLLILIGVPLLTLIGVIISSITIILPISVLFGCNL